MVKRMGLYDLPAILIHMKGCNGRESGLRRLRSSKADCRFAREYVHKRLAHSDNRHDEVPGLPVTLHCPLLDCQERRDEMPLLCVPDQLLGGDGELGGRVEPSCVEPPRAQSG